MMDQELQAKLKRYRLSKNEYERINGLLGRPPQGVEWALFSALWSEHCSYKSSRVHLKKFAFKSARVLQSFGENAGVIDLGHGEKVAFKMESHNHPSFIEPYQGAATGVGGILRDIFTMGARPIALANYLCFGDPKAPRMASLVEGVVGGISGYGNCVGVPTITGQTEFHSSYNTNILVNALAVGLFNPDDPVVTSQARGVGNWVVYVGAKTGRDGVHGASMASESFAENSESKRPTVQIGDPFYEKLLIESCLEVMKQDLVVAIQDMGAAGLTSSSFEMASKGGVGFKLHLDQVPLRDSSVGPEEILLSESQERMLLICEPQKFPAIQKVFHHWGLDAQKIGEIIEGTDVELFWKGDSICRINPRLLTDNAPMYERPYEPWSDQNKVSSLGGLGFSLREGLPRVLSHVQGCSREWIFRQYDQRVGAQTIRDCQQSVSAVRLPSSGRALGLVLGCRPPVMRMDARLGGRDAVLYPAVELASKGFEALAVTDCLNFGNPEKTKIMSEFVAAVDGLAESSRLLNAPVISGNVSFYNETLDQNITSTPSTGVVGLRKTLDSIPYSQFVVEGQEIWLWRTANAPISSGSFAEVAGASPQWAGSLSLHETTRWIESVRDFCSEFKVSTSRVVGKFGLAYALARMTSETMGCEVQSGPWLEAGLGESAWAVERFYEVLLCVDHETGKKLRDLAQTTGTPAWCIGQTVKGRLQIGGVDFKLAEIAELYKSGWRKNFETMAR